VLTIPGSVRIFIGSTPIDMRKSIDGLMAIVQEELREDAYSGHLFVFVSRRRDRAKILAWEVTIAKLHLLEAVWNKRRSSCPSTHSEVFPSQ
jgi:transposase